MDEQRVTNKELRVLDELQRNFSLGRARNNTLEGRATMLIQSATIATSLLSAVQAVTGATLQIWATYSVLGLFALTFLSGLYIWLPIQTRHRPMAAESWDHIYTTYLHVSDYDNYLQLVSNYVFAIENESKRNSKFANALTFGGIALGVQVVAWVALIAVA